jgi:pimeloyl-ACP methyl ester carboxylesterase
MGHSLGAACAAAQAVADPTSVDALILVAPAIVAGRPGGAKPPATALARAAAAARAFTLAAATLALGTLLRAAILLASPLIVTGLRGAVRSAAFWEAGLASAWASGAPPAALVQRYRAPSLLAGWEAGLICFLLARVPTASPAAAARAAAAGKPTAASAQLAAAVAAASLPVLILHGDRDALVPVANSVRLGAQLPGARVVRLAGRGHTPHEEAPAEFVAAVAGWLGDVREGRG